MNLLTRDLIGKSFVGTYMEHPAEQLMIENISKNMYDSIVASFPIVLHAYWRQWKVGCRRVSSLDGYARSLHLYLGRSVGGSEGRESGGIGYDGLF